MTIPEPQPIKPMTTPHYINPRKLSPFDLYQPIPTDFEENLTYIEFLTGILKQLNALIENSNTQNTNITNLYNYVKNFVDNLNINDEVDKKIQAMVSSGEFSTLLLNAIQDSPELLNIIKGYINEIDFTSEIQAAVNELVTDGTVKNILTEVINEKYPLKKYLFLGDSYNNDYTQDGSQVQGWSKWVKQYMSLSDTQFKTAMQGGAGFALSGIHAFSNLVNIQPNDDEVTDVVICGGYNDHAASISAIKSGIAACRTLVRSKFPNAELHIGFIGNTTNCDIKNDLGLRICWYIEGCEENDCHYLTNVEYALHHYYEDFGTDGIHPNNKGQQRIAKAIVQALLTGSANVSETYALMGVMPNDGQTWKLGTSLINGQAFVHFQDNFSLSVNQNYTFNGNTWLDLGALIAGYIIGNSVNGATWPITCCCSLVGGGYRNINGYMRIHNGHLWFNGNLINNTGDNWLTLHIENLLLERGNWCLNARQI